MKYLLMHKRTAVLELDLDKPGMIAKIGIEKGNEPHHNGSFSYAQIIQITTDLVHRNPLLSKNDSTLF